MWVCVGQIVTGTDLYVGVWWTYCFRDWFLWSVWWTDCNNDRFICAPLLDCNRDSFPPQKLAFSSQFHFKPTHTHNSLTKTSPHSQFTHQNQPTLTIHSPKPAHTHNSLTKTSPHSQFTHQNQPTLTIHSPKPAHTHNSLTKNSPHSQFTHLPLMLYNLAASYNTMCIFPALYHFETVTIQLFVWVAVRLAGQQQCGLVE